MNPYKSMIQMLKQLLQEMDVVQSMGAGYYTCSPFANRYNKLLHSAQKMLAGKTDLIETFEAMEEVDPKDPSDKSKRLLGIRVEIGQLITLLQAADEGDGA